MNDSDDRDLWPARLAWLVDVAALVYSVIPPLILGRMKLPLAQELHQKALQTDANMNKGDWLAGLAGVVGITGVAFGYWWADAEAFIVPKDEFDLLNRLRKAYDVAHAVDWRLHDVNIVPVRSLE